MSRATTAPSPQEPAPPRPPDGGRIGPGLAARDGWVVTTRNLRHFVRQPRLLIFSTIQPMMFVVLFAFVFGEAVGQAALPAGLDYIDFLLPGVFVQATAFRSIQTAVGLAEDLERGVVDRFRSMPMARSAVLVGRTSADLIRGVSVIGLMTAVGYAIGFRFRVGVLPAIGAVLVVVLFALALSWIFAALALFVPGAEAVQAAGFVVAFPLVFASSVFVPVHAMPTAMAAFAEVSPVTFNADAARALAIGGPTARPLLAALAWDLGLLALFVPFAVRKYRRME